MGVRIFLLRNKQSFHCQKAAMNFLTSLYYASNPNYEDEIRMLPASAIVCRQFTIHQDKPPSSYIDITSADSQVQASPLSCTT
jgi:hypothetical protein